MEHVASVSELPYPNGWFAVAFSKELKPGAVLRRRLMGEEVVVYRTRGGTPVVTKPFCPHLGAHLGYGGKVKGEEIVCPFHGFAFAPSGSCTRTGYGTKPPKVRLDTYETRECNGAVFAWWHAERLAPYWELPELRSPGYAKPIRITWSLAGLPQDVHENSIDSGHFAFLHGYRDGRMEWCTYDGIESKSSIMAVRPFPLGLSLKIPYRKHTFGLGFAQIHLGLPALAAEIEAYMFTTPTDPHKMEFRVSGAIRGNALGRGRAGMALSWLLTHTAGPWLRGDFGPDNLVYDTKAYLDKPRLVEGDGPIQRYRHWARQFYTWPDETHEETKQAPQLVPLQSERVS